MAILNYTPIEPLIDVDFKTAEKKQLREFFKWFVGEIPNRIGELQRAINSTNDHKLILDFSRESLSKLGLWFSEVAEMRQLSKSEIRDWEAKIPRGWDVPTTDMTNQTKFLGVDIGIYVAETLRQKHASLKWTLVETGKSFADYGRPVLSGFLHRMRFDPMGTGQVLAGKIAKNPRLILEIQECLDAWNENIQRN
jgi:hypothetical protein